MCLAGGKTYDLMKIAHLGGKGRVQDQKNPADSQISAILSMGKDAIPLLIKDLESERAYGRPPVDFWPKMTEGDVALVVLTNLFLDPTWRQSTLPELCWDNLLERTSSETPAWQLLDNFVAAHGRAELASRWRQTWLREGAKMKWDSKGRFFRIEGRELVECTPDTFSKRKL